MNNWFKNLVLLLIITFAFGFFSTPLVYFITIGEKYSNGLSFLGSGINSPIAVYLTWGLSQIILFFTSIIIGSFADRYGAIKVTQLVLLLISLLLVSSHFGVNFVNGFLFKLFVSFYYFPYIFSYLIVCKIVPKNKLVIGIGFVLVANILGSLLNHYWVDREAISELLSSYAAPSDDVISTNLFIVVLIGIGIAFAATFFIKTTEEGASNTTPVEFVSFLKNKHSVILCLSSILIFIGFNRIHHIYETFSSLLAPYNLYFDGLYPLGIEHIMEFIALLIVLPILNRYNELKSLTLLVLLIFMLALLNALIPYYKLISPIIMFSYSMGFSLIHPLLLAILINHCSKFHSGHAVGLFFAFEILASNVYNHAYLIKGVLSTNFSIYAVNFEAGLTLLAWISLGLGIFMFWRYIKMPVLEGK